MRFTRLYSLFSIVLSLLLVGGMASPGLSQSRRQPPTSNEKKNKRPGETPKQDEKQDPLPPDIVPTKPQDLEKVTITTQIVNVDAVVYHKKSGQIVTGLRKENFTIFSDGVQQPITNFSTPEAPITVAIVAIVVSRRKQLEEEQRASADAVRGSIVPGAVLPEQLGRAAQFGEWVRHGWASPL